MPAGHVGAFVLASCIGLAATGIGSRPVAAQETTVVPSEQQVRQWADEAARKAAGVKDSSTRVITYIWNFRTLVKSVLRDYDSSHVSVYTWGSDRGLGGITAWPVGDSEGGITIGVVGPLAYFERQSTEAIRTGQSLAKVRWLGGPAVFVLPHGPYALDIAKVVVESDGAVVAPRDASQYGTPFNAQWLEIGGSAYVTRSAVVNLHGGHIVYPSWAFAPGRVVKVTVVSSAGWTHVKGLSAKDLRKLS